MISLRLDDELAEKLETFAKREGISRSMAIRALVAAGLKEPSTITAAREFAGLRRRFLAKLTELVEQASA